MAGEHVILLDEQDKPTGMLEKYAAHTLNFEQAVERRCRFELGVEITRIVPVFPGFRYRAVAPNGIVENEVCPVYAARVASALRINPDEVMDFQWSHIEDVLSAIRATPWAFSPWMVMQAADDNARNALISFSRQA
ncbi:MAG: isopentenyl-diphosphate Delta-isomerase [Klebsiella oxytoca]|nr:isopentenyl-diphosphate Delta-isomerase [Klebsiella oxytoca]